MGFEGFGKIILLDEKKNIVNRLDLKVCIKVYVLFVYWKWDIGESFYGNIKGNVW